MTFTERNNPGRKLCPGFGSRLENLITPFTATIHRGKKMSWLVAPLFLIPFSALADDNYNVTNGIIGAVVPKLAVTGNDTLPQLMTAVSVFAVVGMIVQRCSRFFQKRRLRPSFHIWGLW